MSSTVAVIPARGGSKGIPLKNLCVLGGAPLIARTIQVSKNSKYVERVIVTTDSEEIAEVSSELEAEVIRRPPELASDESPTVDAVIHVLDTIHELGAEPSIVILLQPTSPFVSSEDIDHAIELFKESDGDSVVSVSKAKKPPQWHFSIQDGYLIPLLGWDGLSKRRQDLAETYIPNGAIFVSTPEIIRKRKSFYTEKTIPYIMPAERSIDIDDELDLKFAEFMIERYGNASE